MPYGDKALNQNRLRSKIFVTYSEKGAPPLFLPAAEKGAAQRNGGAASRTLTPDLVHEVKHAENVLQRTAACPKYKPDDHRKSLYVAITSTSAYCRTTCTRGLFSCTYVGIFSTHWHLHISCR